jgi:hypothetical protein
MTTSEKAGLLLIGGTVATFAMMGIHPTGGDVVAEALKGESHTLNTVAHILAIAAECMLLIGTLGLTLQLTGNRDLAVSAFAVFALAIVAYLIASVTGGFIAPAVIAEAAKAQGAARDAMMNLYRFSGELQMPFAKVGASLTSVAIALWSGAMMRRFSRALGRYGLLLGVAGLVGLTLSRGRLVIHGFGGQIMLGQAAWMIWMIWSGVLLWRGHGDSAEVLPEARS